MSRQNDNGDGFGRPGRFFGSLAYLQSFHRHPYVICADFHTQPPLCDMCRFSHTSPLCDMCRFSQLNPYDSGGLSLQRHLSLVRAGRAQGELTSAGGFPEPKLSSRARELLDRTHACISPEERRIPLRAAELCDGRPWATIHADPEAMTLRTALWWSAVTASLLWNRSTSCKYEHIND